MTEFLPLITGSAGALVVLALVAWAFYEGRIHSDREFSKLERENEDLKSALAFERRGTDEVAQVGSVTNQLIKALTSIATDHHVEHEVAHRQSMQLTGEDVGL